MIAEESSKVDWARLLLDESTDNMIINFSREKIANELIQLRTELKNLKLGITENNSNEFTSK